MDISIPHNLTLVPKEAGSQPQTAEIGYIASALVLNQGKTALFIAGRNEQSEQQLYMRTLTEQGRQEYRTVPTELTTGEQRFQVMLDRHARLSAFHGVNGTALIVTGKNLCLPQPGSGF